MKWVVKIGGSLHDSPRLKETVLRAGEFDASVLIVPGGGPFADQVRASQKRWKFDDRCAHAMALLGMRQYGRLLAALGGFAVTERIEMPSSGDALRVWLPGETSLDGQLAASWDVSADSIAAWLAGQLDADWLILVKSASPDALKSSLEMVDVAFPDTLKAHGAKLRCALVGADQWLDRDFSCEACRFLPDNRR